MDYPEALRRLQPALLQLLKNTTYRFDKISILTTSNCVLFDVAGQCQTLRIPYLISEAS